jgi:hypothetical protein
MADLKTIFDAKMLAICAPERVMMCTMRLRHHDSTHVNVVSFEGHKTEFQMEMRDALEKHNNLLHQMLIDTEIRGHQAAMELLELAV